MLETAENHITKRAFSSVNLLDSVISRVPSGYIHKEALKLYLASENGESDIILDLELNRHLFHPQFSASEPLENCYYHGKVVGDDNSWAAVSTCDGILKGSISTGGRVFELSRSSSGPSYILTQQKGQKNHTCTLEHDHTTHLALDPLEIHLSKRSAPVGPLYLELVIVNDFQRVAALGKDITSNTLQLANRVSQIYKDSLQLFVVLKSVVNLPYSIAGSSNDASVILSEFQKYQQANKLPDNDHAQLLLGRDISSNGQKSTSGLSNVGSLCSDNSVSVVEAFPGGSTDGTSNTMAHEIGHAVNMPHDREGAAVNCKGGIMEATSCSNCRDAATRKFTSCSIQIGKAFIQRSKCLQNVPQSAARCGNGVVDSNEGEECDEDSQCCDKNICRFKQGDCTKDGVAGMCSLGKCISTCGNGKVEPYEDCDTKSLTNGCCDPNTCKFETEKSTCSKGICNGGSSCVANTITAVLPLLNMAVKFEWDRYIIKFNEIPNGAKVYYSLDGSTPDANSTRSMPFSHDLSISVEDVKKGFENSKALFEKTAFKNPYAPDDDGVYRLKFSAKAYHPELLSSPVASTMLEFGESTQTLSPGAITGIVLGILAVILIAILSYFRRLEIVRVFNRQLGRSSNSISRLRCKISRPHLTLKRKSSEEKFDTVKTKDLPNLPVIVTEFASESMENVSYHANPQHGFLSAGIHEAPVSPNVRKRHSFSLTAESIPEEDIIGHYQ